MKTIIGISIALAIILLNGCAQKAQEGIISGVDLISIHEITTKPGIDEKEFEKFVMNEIAPLYKNVNGQDLFLSKGYVGQRTGQYAIFITFPTVEARNQIYHLNGDWDKDFASKLDSAGPIIWEKFDSFAYGFDGQHNTDYLRVEIKDE